MNLEHFIQWQDLFVVVDDGSVPLERYESIEELMQQQAKQFPTGIACLVILPPDAKPPPDDIKQTVKDVFVRMAPSITCLAYIIEGAGFKAVAARAALVSMRIFSSRPYPIYVETSMRDALAKVIPHLNRSKNGIPDVKVIIKAITDARAKWAASVSAPAAKPSPSGDVLSK